MALVSIQKNLLPDPAGPEFRPASATLLIIVSIYHLRLAVDVASVYTE